MLGELGNFLKKKGLPLLGAVAGGPAGIAGAIIGNIAGELGLESSDEDQIIKHIESNPDTVFKLKKLEADSKAELKRLNLQGAEIKLKEEQAFLDDKQDARSRETDFIKATGGRDWSQTILAWIIVGGFFGALFAFIGGVNPAGNEILLVLTGTMAAKFGSVVDYFFGSSKGSSDKNKMIEAGKTKEEKKEEKKGGLG